jgi:hypothetical protein
VHNTLIPIGTMVVALLSIQESRASTEDRRLDVPGLVASAVPLFSLTYAPG